MLEDDKAVGRTGMVDMPPLLGYHKALRSDGTFAAVPLGMRIPVVDYKVAYQEEGSSFLVGWKTLLSLKGLHRRYHSNGETGQRSGGDRRGW